MHAKTLVLLLGATGLAAASAAMALKNRQSAVTVAQDTGRFFPTLIDSLNDVATVSIRTAESSFTLERNGDTWTLAEKDGYAAEGEPVRKLLIGIAELHRIEAKTKDPARWAKLGVEDVDTTDAASKLVSLKDSAGTELASLVVGNTRASQGRSRVKELYVRAPGDDQSWLVQGAVDVKSAQKDWLQKEIYSIPQSRIQSIRIEHADGETLHVRKEDEDAPGFAVLDLEQGQELRFPTVANSMAGGVSNIRLDDVQSAGSPDGVDFETDWLSKTTLRTFDGMTLHAILKDVDGTSFVTFTAGYEPPAEPPQPEPVDDEGDKAGDGEPVAALDDAGPTPAEVQAEVDELNARFAGWTYVIPQYNRTTMTKRLADMIKEPAPEESDDGPMVIPDTLPPEIQEQIKAHQESLGNTTVTRTPDASDEDGDGDDGQ